jgi:hypothetical protein
VLSKFSILSLFSYVSIFSLLSLFFVSLLPLLGFALFFCFMWWGGNFQPGPCIYYTPERVIHSRPKHEWAEEERAVATQYAIHLFRPRNYKQKHKDGPTAVEQGMDRIQHMNRGPQSVESPRRVFKAGSATKMKGDPYVRKTQLPNS